MRSIDRLVQAYGEAKKTFSGLHGQLQDALADATAVGKLRALLTDPSRLGPGELQQGLRLLRTAGEHELADLLEKVHGGDYTSREFATAGRLLDDLVLRWASKGQQVLGEVSRLEVAASQRIKDARQIQQTQHNAFMDAIGNMKG